MWYFINNIMVIMPMSLLRAIEKTVAKNTTDIVIWGSFLVASLIVFFFVSSKDFSFLLVALSPCISIYTSRRPALVSPRHAMYADLCLFHAVFRLHPA